VSLDDIFYGPNQLDESKLELHQFLIAISWC
jgi:hypothetical protein